MRDTLFSKNAAAFGIVASARKPATVEEIPGEEILVEAFMRPMGPTQATLADAMGVRREHINEPCNGAAE